MYFLFLLKSVGSELLEMLSRFGYGGAFVLGALDRITISLIPTEILLPAYGFLVSMGRMDLWLTFWIISFGAVLGELVLFWVSAKLGREVVERWGRYFFVSKHDLQHLDRLFAKHGTKIVFWGRLLPVARSLVAIPAGIGGMNWKPFAAYSFLGILPYNFLFMYLGTKAGENLEFFRQYFSVLEKIAYAILIIAIVWYVYRHLSKKHLTHND